MMERIELSGLALEPAALFAGLAERPGSAYLDSALIDEHGLGRWSFVAWDPFLTLSGKGDAIPVRKAGRFSRSADHPLQILRALLQRYRSEKGEGPVPFASGAIGYLAYDLGHALERRPRTTNDDLQLPDLYFTFHDFVLAYDHLGQRWFLAGEERQGGERPALARRRDEVMALAEKAAPAGLPEISPAEPVRFSSNFTREDYLRAIVKAKHYIREGDIYQVNLSQRFCAPAPGPAWPLYWRLRRANAAPFAAFLQAGDFQVLSSSPERFLRLESGRVETRPIKGTRPRGRTPAEDARLAQELLTSEKDHAELNMIVDLERNDLGRVCAYGTVRVTRHAALESYARVHHLVSTVAGQLLCGKDTVDLIRAAFPGGSITGAPKIRAMQIIDELEPTSRSVYTGAIGWLGFNGDLDLNIAIRTMIAKGGEVFFQAGGGIVADSDPEAEYQETLDKAQALFEALNAG